MDLYPFKAGPIEPICLDGNIVGLWMTTTFYFRRVIYHEPIVISDPLINNFGILAAGGNVGGVQMNLLEMPKEEFGQFRCFVIDDVELTLRQPAATARKGTKNFTSRVTRFSDLRDECHHQTEFYVWENNFAFFDCLNPRGYGITQSQAAFYGFRYRVEEVKDANNQPLYSWPAKPPPTWTRVPASALAGG